jgi:HEPN domain-containing protein
MPRDRARVADTRAWLVKAKEDLDGGARLLKPSKALPGVAVFHCQQAAEKALKAFLVWHDVPFRKTLYLKEVGDACVELDAALKEAVGRAVPLTEYAWKFCYPGELKGPSRKEVQIALALATEVFKAILARLPKEARP